jgi:rhodanese-related sulfurtransferase
MTPRITREELRAAIEGGHPPAIVEALPAPYYEEAHIPGAINIDHGAIERLAPRLLPDRSAPVVTYCASVTCQNSGIAAEKLAALGYSDVRVYAEGKQDWLEAALPLERGAAPVAH